MSLTLEVKLRDDQGKGSSRRLRHAFRIPAIIYGANKDATAISLDFHQISHLIDFNETIFTSVLPLQAGDITENVIIKDLQRHPATTAVTHVDFLRVDDIHPITASVPLDFINSTENSALRLGAVLNQFINNIEVRCLAKDLPSKVDVDVANLEITQGLRLTDLILPKGVVIKALTHGDIEAHDQTIVSVSSSRKMASEDEIEDEVQNTTNEDASQD